MKHWKPSIELTKKEQFIVKRLKRTRKLFAFLRLHRHELFDDQFQEELAGMYRDTGAGEEPVAPAQLCMALLLQGYHRISDAEAVELTMMDLRWQMVLDCLGADEPAFGQGTLQAFRERLIAADLDRRLLERTVELARQTNEFDWKKLPKDLRLAIDSRPFEGAGRVEDTFNLLGHAARKIVACAAKLTDSTNEEICRNAGIPLLLSSSIKAGLDINWNDPEQKDEAIERLTRQVISLNDWLDRHQLAMEEPLKPYLEALSQVRKQDLEVSKGHVQLRRGVAEDRRVSIEDADMRHGRKTKSKRFDGYKQHIGADLDTDLILGCAVTSANRPEEEATPMLEEDLKRMEARIDTLSIDRAYVNSSLVREVIASGGTVLAKPWSGRNSRGPDLFGKRISRSICGRKRLPARPDRWNISSPVRWWNSIRRRAGPAPFETAVHCQRPGRAGRSTWPKTRRYSNGCASCKLLVPAAASCESEPVSNTASRTSQPAKVRKLATAGRERTSSTCAASPPQKTSTRPGAPSSEPPMQRPDTGFNPFGALVGRTLGALRRREDYRDSLIFVIDHCHLV